MSTAPILLTGAAGFIGAHIASHLSTLGHKVVGCDNFNDYYDPNLKRARVSALLTPLEVRCEAVDVSDGAALSEFVARHRPETVIHLAAQPGARHSVSHPQSCVNSNLVGFANLLEASKLGGVKHVMYASSSSVYGDSSQTPFVESHRTDTPVSMYAATKKANEMMAHAYSHVHGLRCTGLRFFTVYGPWGRPDMAYFSFAQNLVAGKVLPVFADGMLQRDFTYVDDIVEGVVRLALSQQNDIHQAHEIFNIGNQYPVTVLDFIQTLASLLGVAPRFEFLPMQAGDVRVTCANVDKLHSRVGFQPATPLREGLSKFVEWFEAWRSDGWLNRIAEPSQSRQ